MPMRNAFRALSFPLALAGAAQALTGVSVTCHYETKSYNIDYGGFGAIWRHDIVNDAVTADVKLYDGPARSPVISADGGRIAFLTKGDSVAVMPLAGGPVTLLAKGSGGGSLDWSGPWIYFNAGYPFTEASRQVKRVNADTKAVEDYLTFSEPIWRFALSKDGSRAAVRGNNWDTPTKQYGNIFLYDMTQRDGTLDRARSSHDAKAQWDWQCQEAISPSGDLWSDGWITHEGTSIKKWADLSQVQDLKWADANAWGPATGNSGSHATRINWSVNSEKWICAFEGFNNKDCEGGGNQVLMDYQDQKRIVVTHNADGSGAYDENGDFFEGMPTTAIRLAPPRAAGAGRVPGLGPWLDIFPDADGAGAFDARGRRLVSPARP